MHQEEEERLRVSTGEPELIRFVWTRLTKHTFQQFRCETVALSTVQTEFLNRLKCVPTNAFPIARLTKKATDRLRQITNTTKVAALTKYRGFLFGG
jgi:hypothetical protein